MNVNGNGSEIPGPHGISRRLFLKLATAAGLLAGCASQPPAGVGPTSAPSPSPTGLPPGLAPTGTPMGSPPRLKIEMYPDGPSRVVRVRHPGAWDGENLVPEALGGMLDAGISNLTGLNDAIEAWGALFDPGERIGIKVNTIDTSRFWTHAPLVAVVVDRLLRAAIPAEQIVVFDRSSRELEAAGYEVGVRCYGSDGQYTREWQVLDTEVGLSNILLECDALINMPILKVHNHSGVTFAMKNHFGTFDRPSRFHRPRTGEAIVALNALEPIRERTRLVIGDALQVSHLCPGAWLKAVKHDAIVLSFDPVAHDAVGLQMLTQIMAAEGRDPAAATELAEPWLAQAAAIGLGTNDPQQMELVEVSLG